jgi:uncharacterized protein YndB with AHSA1/START domain
MTAPKPTGRISGNDLVLTRTFRAPIADVWASVTESERCTRWYGRWEGTPGAGNTIRVQMLFEKGEPWTDMLIEACEPPRHLVLSSTGDYGVRLEVTFAEASGVTTMTFTHRDVDKQTAGDYGAGWEYYLDNLVASRDGAPLPKFDDYYPSQKQYFTDQL